MSVFISHSHKDPQISEDLVTLLVANGVDCWIDSHGLIPGTPEWDKAVRAAISSCNCVIAVCSESAKESNYVAIELAIANSLQKQIFPVWVSGTSWPLSAPMSLVLSQFSDLRASNRANGFLRLLDALFPFLGRIEKSRKNDVQWPFIEVVYKDRAMAINPFAFDTRAQFLTEIFIALLDKDFAPFTYGVDWALDLGGAQANMLGRKEIIRWLAVPADWAIKSLMEAAQATEKWTLSRPDIWSGRIRHISWVGCEPLQKSIEVTNLRALRESMGLPVEASDREKPRIVGIRAIPEVCAAIVSGGHPKGVVINARQRTYEPPSLAALDRFDLNELLCEGALAGEGTCFDILTQDRSFEYEARAISIVGPSHSQSI